MNKKKKHLTHSLYTQVTKTSDELDTFVYFLIDESPPTIYSREYSQVYEMLQSLFSEDPIPEDEALEAIKTAGFKDPKSILFKDPKSILSWMTYFRYLHKVSLKEVLK